MDLARGWARVGAWVTVGAGAVAALLGASALSMLAAMAQRVTGNMAELRYAIACAEAGAVPGGMVH